MEITEQIRLRFKGVDFPHVSLDSESRYQPSDDSEVDICVEPKVFIPSDKSHTFNIVMNVKVSVEGFFTIDVVAVGYFELSIEAVTEKVRKSFINANSTAIMFPYVRAFISTLTSNVGKVITPIVLPTRFFKGELEEMTDESLE